MDPASVLLVDDNKDDRMLTAELLTREALNVRVAVSAEDALPMIESQRPRLMLVDVELPGIDGLELTRRIRKSKDGREITIVALTACDGAGDEAMARTAGCNGYIVKPIDTDTFAGIVRQYLFEGEEGPQLVMGNRGRRPGRSSIEIAAKREVAKLAVKYLADRSADAERMTEALGRAEFESIQRLAHNMKGTGGGYGHPELTLIGGRLEQAARNRSPVAILAELTAMFDYLRKHSKGKDRRRARPTDETA